MSQRWSPGLPSLLHSPAIPPGLSMSECGAMGCHPPLCLPHSPQAESESGPLSLSARMCGRRVCQWSDCLPRSSHTPSVSVPPRQLESSLPRLPVSASPSGLDEGSFFYLLGVGLPCHSSFCQFWLCEEAQCVYLRCHLGSISLSICS